MQSENSIATVDPSPEQQLATIVGLPGSLWTSFVKGDRSQMLVMGKALTNPDVELAEYIDKPIQLVHLLLHKCNTVNKQTGEIEEFVRSVLIDADGVSYATGSDVVSRTLAQFVAMFGLPPYNPPLPVKVLKVKSSSVGHYFKLVLAPDATTLKPPTRSATNEAKK